MRSDAPTARDRLVAGAADLLARHGLGTMTVRELARHADAPLGSTYHYFPGGKPELAAEAVRWADREAGAVLRQGLVDGPIAGLRAFVQMWRRTLVDSDFGRGCAVVAVAVHENPGDAARDAAVFAFSTWTAELSAALRRCGVSHGAAADLATLVVAAVEGAVAMCRAERSVQPLEAVAAQLEGLLRS
ncbi:helix-turn-helix domain containing protein [Mycolicibacterium neoaurum]|uniref:TetR/AcrR family transcriptional regulator n=1 Tax=Mycolicibacterium neoaurum TaxID=1795 RepID=UPI00248C1BE8|nr:helix-turn-helix domain-containing protein [Mycolicibacterium neoaurum]MDO3400224.1 helix-turn-helix domain-containing protein [Mycolicibacterium neoaurum]WBP92679.1 helix-turn-helix domain containing protein [Mycolicibacterium neoaurum]WBS06241.1 helix-turn-helix domain containing protein [Mycolicibacterium neoaurum]